MGKIRNLLDKLKKSEMLKSITGFFNSIYDCDSMQDRNSEDDGKSMEDILRKFSEDFNRKKGLAATDEERIYWDDKIKSIESKRKNTLELER